MTGDLPTTAIGLIGFIIAGAGLFLWRVINKFMSYIETKNANLEKATKLFTDNMTERDRNFDDTLQKHADRTKEMFDDFAARLESTIPTRNKKKR